MTSLQNLSGIVPPLVTPLRDNELDAAGLARVVSHLINGGVHGLFVLGTTGEGPSLNYRTRRTLIDAVCDQVADAAPVLVGVTDTALGESLDMARAAESAGAAGVVYAPPCYFPTTQPALLEAARRLAAESPLPVVLYNMPALTKTPFDVATVEALTREPNIAGFKDSSGDLPYFQQVLKIAESRPDWFVMTGPEELLAESLALGGDGGVCGGANVTPSLFVNLYNACVAQDATTAEKLQKQVLRLGDLYQLSSDPGIRVIQGIKAALASLGVCGAELAEPYASLTDATTPAVRAVLDDVLQNPKPTAAIFQ